MNVTCTQSKLFTTIPISPLVQCSDFPSSTIVFVNFQVYHNRSLTQVWSNSTEVERKSASKILSLSLSPSLSLSLSLYIYIYTYIQTLYVNVQCQYTYIKNISFITHELYFGFFQTFQDSMWFLVVSTWFDLRRFGITRE